MIPVSLKDMVCDKVEQLLGIPAFLEEMPPLPDKCAICFEVTRAFGAVDYGLYSHTMQLAFRAGMYEEAEQMALAAFDAFNSGPEEDEIALNETTSVIGRPRQLPFFLERDGSKRYVFCLNLVLHSNER